ncbi:site-specific integrase [Pseudomonas sp. NPDC086278]|uniref:site-specific integrase n=1 Tax=Pseudomonas sp. NPDC086278 TaxID=3390646 RepID=UPI003D005E3F
MLQISRELISYKTVRGKEVSHYVLIAHEGKNRVLISHVNLYLYENTRASNATSNKYSSVLSGFYSYLSTLDKFKLVPVGSYHTLADNEDIKSWQEARQTARVKTQKAFPTSETIFNDAQRVVNFFAWLKKEHFEICVDVQFRTWIANFKSDQLLSHIQRKAEVTIDFKNITVLDRERRQQQSYSLITNDEIKTLIRSYPDPVYAALFKLSLGTAMRPSELCKFPYIGNGANSHIQPYENMVKEGATVPYLISLSKGFKSRTIRVNLADLKALEEHYIKPHYHERARLYKERYGKKCPPSILFLTAQGVPITSKMISDRTLAAKKLAMATNSQFRESVVFYDARHWWPTMFLIKRFKQGLLEDSTVVRDMAAIQAITQQMGHDNFSTTYNHYIDQARLLLLAQEGYVNDLVTNPDQSVEEFIECSS